MDFYIVIAVSALLVGLWNLTIAVLGCVPRFRATAVGTLTKANSKQNVRTRHGGIIPILTRYAYTYTVNGKEYRYSSEEHHGKRRLFAKAPMVYVKWFPRHAYPNKFKGTTEWVLGIMMLLMGILCFAAMK